MTEKEVFPILSASLVTLSGPVRLDWASLQNRNLAAALLDAADPALLAVAEVAALLSERLASPGWCWHCGFTAAHQDDCPVGALSGQLEALGAAVRTAGTYGTSGQ